MRIIYVLITAFALSLTAQAQAPTLLKDINTGIDGSNPTNFFRFGDKVLFRAESATLGTELWMTDGTPAGTVLLKDINTDPTRFSGSSNPDNFTLYKGKAYFTARSGDLGLELYVTDGTTDGTVLVKDIQPGDGNGAPFDLLVYRDLLYFTANDGTNSSELWVSDGTTAGTRLAVDINPAGGTSNPVGKYIYKDLMYFSANDGTAGAELMSSDGTPAGTKVVKDIRPGSSNSLPSRFFAYNGLLYFRANDGVTGTELYRTDGTTAGTERVIDLKPGDSRSSSNPDNFTLIGDYLVFTADDGSSGEELYSTTGDSASVTRLADINVGAGGSNATQFVSLVDDQVYAFVADTSSGDIGSQIYTIQPGDGDQLRIDRLDDVFPALGGVDPQDLTFTGSYLYFSYDSPTTGRELAGLPIATGAGVKKLGEVRAGPFDSRIDDIFLYENQLLFEATDSLLGLEPYTVAASTAYVELLDPDGEVIAEGDTIRFTDASLGLAGFATLAFRNTGTDTARLYTLRVGDGGTSVFAFGRKEGVPTDAIPVGQGAQAISFLYEPQVAGDFVERVEVAFTSAGGGEKLNFFVAFAALVPELAVAATPTGAGLAPGSELTFTGVGLGLDSVRSVFVRNLGAGALQITGVALAKGAEFRVTQPANIFVGPDVSEEIKVTFRSSVGGSFTDTLLIRTSLPNADSLFKVVLKATATSGIADLGLGTRSVFPNPVQNFVTVELAESISGGQWEISNAAGQIVSRGTWPGNSDRHQIDMQVLPKGVYQLSVFSGERGMVVQLVK